MFFSGTALVDSAESFCEKSSILKVGAGPRKGLFFLSRRWIYACFKGFSTNFQSWSHLLTIKAIRFMLSAAQFSADKSPALREVLELIAERWTEQEGLKQGRTMPFFKNSEVHRFSSCPKTSHRAFQVGESPGSPAFFVSAALPQGRKEWTRNAKEKRTKVQKQLSRP